MQTLHVRPRRIVLQSHAIELGGRSMRRAALASYIGSAIEFYDFFVGLIPSTAAIGIAAPLLLITMRLLQGLAVGGEWAGAALLCAESAPREKRSYACMFTQLGLGTALVLTNLVFLLSHTLLGTSSAAFRRSSSSASSVDWSPSPVSSCRRGSATPTGHGG